tara:strand:- start:555 stop:734 length:180 start_codon:yes stop_codon:yes gene_type:complete
MKDEFYIDSKITKNLNLFHKMQEASVNNDDITVSVDENGEVEFEMDLELFLHFLKDALE